MADPFAGAAFLLSAGFSATGLLIFLFAIRGLRAAPAAQPDAVA
jgi:hypothetical protein